MATPKPRLLRGAALGLATVAALAVGAGMGPAYGCDSQDRKYYPGSLCRPERKGTSFLVKQGTIYNKGASPLAVVCPVVQHLALCGGNLRVVFEDNNPAGTPLCVLMIDSHYGLHAQSSLATNAGTVQFAFGDILDGYYALKCWIPGASAGQLSGLRAVHLKEKF